jgi:hypothetical protein
MPDWRRLLGTRWSPGSEQGSFLHDGLEVHIMRRSHRMKRIMREQWGHFLPSTLNEPARRHVQPSSDTEIGRLAPVPYV